MPTTEPIKEGPVGGSFAQSQATIVVKQDDVARQQSPIQLWRSNYLSNWFFIWTYPIIGRARRQKPGVAADKVFDFRLRPGERARENADDLSAAWLLELNTYGV